MDNMKWLGENLRQLVNLQNLKLNVCFNNLGAYGHNMKNIGDGIIYLQSLIHLDLDLSVNDFDGNKKLVYFLGECMKYMSHNLENLVLNLGGNQLGENDEIMQQLSIAMK